MSHHSQNSSMSRDIDRSHPKRIQIHHRGFLRHLSSSLRRVSLVILLGFSVISMNVGCQGETSYDASYEPYWTYRADRLEEYQIANFQGVRTQESPGDKDPSVHVPLVYVKNSIVTAKINHVMETDHWITTVYFRDTETSRVFYLKEFFPREKDPGEERGITVQAPLPDEVNRFAVFAFCNKYDLWMSDVISF